MLSDVFQNQLHILTLPFLNITCMQPAAFRQADFSNIIAGTAGKSKQAKTPRLRGTGICTYRPGMHLQNPGCCVILAVPGFSLLHGKG